MAQNGHQLNVSKLNQNSLETSIFNGYSKFPLAIYFAYGIASFHVTHGNLVTISGLTTPFGPETVTVYLYSVGSLRGGISKGNSYP